MKIRTLIYSKLGALLIFTVGILLVGFVSTKNSAIKTDYINKETKNEARGLVFQEKEFIASPENPAESAEEEKWRLPLSTTTINFLHGNIANQIRKVIPAGAMLRDFERIPNQNDYIVLYVLYPDLIDESSTSEDYGLIEPQYFDCSARSRGVIALDGDYYLAHFKDGKIVDELAIPEQGRRATSDGSANPIAFRTLSTMLGRKGEYSAMKGVSVNDKFPELVPVKLLNLADYNGDGVKLDFQLQGDVLPCSHQQYLYGGFDTKSQKVVLYKIKDTLNGDFIGEVGEREILYKDWHDNFFPDKQGNVLWIWRCGDHGQNSEVEFEKYKFNPKENVFDLYQQGQAACGYEHIL